jgi:hypothetical protein
MAVGGQRHATAVYPREIEPVHIVGEAGWALGTLDGCGKFRLHQDSNPDIPSRSESLYRLCYPGS